MKRLAVIAVLGALLSSSAVAAESCSAEGPGRCYSEFSEFLGVASDGTRRLVAVGQLKSATAPGRGAAIVQIAPAGPVVTIDPPANVSSLGGRPLSYVEGREIVRVAPGEFAVFGIAIFGDRVDGIYAGWAARVGLDGRTRWSRVYAGPDGTHQLFHFGTGLADGRLLAGGRRQLGPDRDGDCSAWSRALVLPIDAETGSPLPGEVVDGSGRERRALYSGVEVPGRGFIFTGFATAPDQSRPGKCQDDVLYVPFDPGLQVIDRQQMGHPAGNDIGFRVVLFDESILVAGSLLLDRPTAFVDAAPVAGGMPLSFRRPAGEGGRDYFNSIAFNPVAGDVIVAGAWSESASGWYRAWWFRLDEDMLPTEEVAVSSYPGSTINGLAVLPDGATVGVGYVRTDPGDSTKQYGWVVDIQPGAGDTTLPPLSVRPADSSLPRLDGLEQRDGAYLAGRLGNAPMGFYHGPAEAGSHYKLDFDAGAGNGLRIVVHPESGDVDAVLRDAEGRLVDFSNYRRVATEVLETATEAGRYRLEILVNEAVAGFDVSLLPADPVGFPQSIGGPVSLDSRRDIALALERFGYFAGSEIDISVSPETVRAFIGIQSATGHEADGVVDQEAWGQIVGR